MKPLVSYLLLISIGASFFAKTAFAHDGKAHNGTSGESEIQTTEQDSLDAAILHTLNPNASEDPIATGTENHHLEMLTGIEVFKGQPDYPTNTLDQDDFVGVRAEPLSPLEQLLYSLNADLIQAETLGLPRAKPNALPGSTVGMWTDVFGWDIIAIHATLLPTGKVLVWDATPDDFDGNDGTNGVSATQVRLWDPLANASQPTDYYQADLFCAGSSHLWDGRILFTGGDAGPSGTNIPILDSTIYNPYDNSWIKTENMNTSRWYASVAVLSSGEMFTLGGTNVSGVKKPSDGVFSEVFQHNKEWKPLSNVAPFFGDNTTGEYMWAQTLPNGDVGVFGPHASVFNIETKGEGRLESKYSRGDGLYRGYGSYALFDEGKVLISGGGLPQGAGSSSAAAKSSVVLNLWNKTVGATADMNFPRRQHNLTLLADGSVLASGGHSGDEYLVDYNVDNQVLKAEIWKDGIWTIVGEMPETRQYHSVALLLPDGSVFSGGGGYCGDCIDQKTYEIYYPPYLFQPGTNMRIPDGERPQFSGTPDRVKYGESFKVQLNGPSQNIIKTHLIKLGSVTHSQNQGQRLANVEWNKVGNNLNITAPTNRNLAPPGHYMLIAIDNNGVPSKGAIVRVGQPLLNPAEVANDIFLGGGLWNTYEILPQGRTGLEITFSGAAAGSEMSVKAGDYPDGASPSVVIGGNGSQTLTVGGDGQAPWYIQVRGPNNSGYSLLANLGDAPVVVAPEPVPQPEAPIDPVVDGGDQVPQPPLPGDLGSMSRGGGGCGTITKSSTPTNRPGGGPLALLLSPLALLFGLRRTGFRFSLGEMSLL